MSYCILILYVHVVNLTVFLLHKIWQAMSFNWKMTKSRVLELLYLLYFKFRKLD